MRLLGTMLAAAGACGALGVNARAEPARHHPAYLTARNAPAQCLERLGPDARLVQVQVVFRHGARTPLTSKSFLWGDTEWDCCGSAYKAVQLQLHASNGDPMLPGTSDERQRATIYAGGCHKGELTQLGQKQALQLGQWLRQRYVEESGFLPAAYLEGLVSARTTNFSRTRATLAGVLTGLFPGHDGPISSTTSSELDEILYADTRTCPHLGSLFEAAAAMHKARCEAEAPLRKSLQEKLSSALSLPKDYFTENRWSFTDLHDVLTSLAAHGKPLPGGLQPGDPILADVNRLATQEFSTFVSPSLSDQHGHQVLRLSMGRLLDLLLANMEAAVEGREQEAGSTARTAGAAADPQLPKMYLYSGHDSSIMPLLVALGADVTSWPPYLSNLVFELWELNNGQQGGGNSSSGSSGNGSSKSAASSSSPAGPTPRYAVRVLYNLHPLQLPGCEGGDGAGFEFWRDAILRPFVLSHTDHAEACAVKITHEGALPQPQGFDLSDPSKAAEASK